MELMCLTVSILLWAIPCIPSSPLQRVLGNGEGCGIEDYSGREESMTIHSIVLLKWTQQYGGKEGKDVDSLFHEHHSLTHSLLPGTRTANVQVVPEELLLLPLISRQPR